MSVQKVEAQRIGVIFIHGTFARESSFSTPLNPIAKRLVETHRDRFDFEFWKWSGRNNHDDRIGAAKNLALQIRSWCTTKEWAKIILIGHSHGGTIAHQACNFLNGDFENKISLVSLGTPFIRMKWRNGASSSHILWVCCFFILTYFLMSLFPNPIRLDLSNINLIELITLLFLFLMFGPDGIITKLLLYGHEEDFRVARVHKMICDPDDRSSSLSRHLAVVGYFDEAYIALAVGWILGFFVPALLGILFIVGTVVLVFPNPYMPRFFNPAGSAVAYFLAPLAAGSFIGLGITFFYLLAKLMLFLPVRAISFGKHNNRLYGFLGLSVGVRPRAWSARDSMVRHKLLPSFSFSGRKFVLSHSKIVEDEKIVKIVCDFVGEEAAMSGTAMETA